MYYSKLHLDPWQKKFLETKGDKLLCTGRQVGKSVVCAIDAGEYALQNGRKTILMIAPTERQAYALFEKTLDYILEKNRKLIKVGKDRPTKTKINLRNGTVIWCLPTGLTGLGIRFLTVHRLYADEASRIPALVWDAITPMMLTTGGDTILLSTPYGTEGYFYDVLINKREAFSSYTRFRTDSETVVRERELCETWTQEQREKALQRLSEERGRMSALSYAQEYMGQPLDDLKQVFSDKLLAEVMKLKRRDRVWENRDYYLGQDIAGMGADLSTWEILDGTNKRAVEHVENITRRRIPTPARVGLTLQLEGKYHFRTIGIDDGGLGSGDFGYLLEHTETRRKTVSLNNARRNLDRDGNRKKSLLKEDMYNNLLAMMEHKEIKLLDDDEIFHSLRSIQFEIDRKQNSIKYRGDDSHIAEGLIRAAWLVRQKTMRPFVHFL